MASFIDGIKAGKAKTAFLKKRALIGSINQELVKIGSLDSETPSIRVFETRQEGAKALLADWLKLLEI